MKKLFLTLLAMVLIGGLIFSGCGTTSSPQASKPASSQAPASSTPAAPASQSITFQEVTFVPKTSLGAEAAKRLAQQVTERSNGQLTIKYLGGPEVMPAMDLPSAVKAGTIDIALFPSTFATSFVPEIFSLPLTQIPPWEERQGGLYDYMVKICSEKMGAYYLGRGQYNAPFYIVLSKSVTKLQDIKGLKVAITGGMGKSFLEKLGAAPTLIQSPETYTAMERHVVDGVWLALQGAMDWSLPEVTKFVIDQPIDSPSIILFMNLGKWNSLSKSQQNLVNEVMVNVEREVTPLFAKATEDAIQGFKSKGSQFVKLSPEESQTYINAFYSTQWDEIKNKVSPEAFDTLRKLTSKK